MKRLRRFFRSYRECRQRWPQLWKRDCAKIAWKDSLDG